MEEIILASGSPRRRELLDLIGVPFRVIKSDAPEVITKTDPGDIVCELSMQKAVAVQESLTGDDRDRIVLGADTIVWCNGAALGKPANRDEARQMLLALQNREHSVFTGVTILKGERRDSFFSETKVFVHAMSEQEIEDYLDTGEPFDKAGAYGIQGPFAAFVDRIEGDYQTVVGLPASAVYQHLKAFA